MTTHTALLLLVFFLTKHIIADFVLQNKYQLQHKGIYGHMGGILHSVIHGAGTSLVLVFVIAPIWALLYGLLDCIVHYHIDWLKVKITELSGWNPSDNGWWYLFGLDQHLHHITYIVFVATLL